MTKCTGCGKGLTEIDIYYQERTNLPYCQSCAEKYRKSKKWGLLESEKPINNKKPKVIMQSQFRCSPFEPFRDIILTAKDLTIGNETYPIKDIAEAFNDFRGFTGVSKLGVRFKNGDEIDGLTIKGSMSNMGSALNVLLGDFSSMTTSMKNVIDKWVNAINTLILMTETNEE